MIRVIRYIGVFLVVNSIFSACTTKTKIPVTAETALERYLDNGDNSFSWTLKEKHQLDGLAAYDLLLTSQQWREHTWKHQLTVLVPNEIEHDGALLYITGGSVKNGEPRWNDIDDERIAIMSGIAMKNKAMCAIIRQVPNQPLYNDLGEDELISFTLHNFRNDGDYTWPLLFPMTKTAIRAMDAVQDFTKENLNIEINRFVVSGGSKRGWTTWLTAANDKRVQAIAPMVIDVLNMPVNLEYQLEVWEDYSVQIEDYVKLEIPQEVHTETGDKITKMVDPYSYRKSLTMPKLIMIGTNDEYWPVDAIKHYFDSIPGENYIHYVPNAGHDLGDTDQAPRALSAFFGRTMSNRPYPKCSWQIDRNGQSVTISSRASPDELLDAVLWTAVSEDRDFRDDEWSGQSLNSKGKSVIDTETALPESGYKAFYVDLIYTDPNGGEYSKSTRMYVLDKNDIL
jgi:PhoPQ-activated pathogenicity-related protein